MTFFELFFFLLWVSIGILCGIYGFNSGGIHLGLFYAVLGAFTTLVSLMSIAKLGRILHRRKLSKVMHCRCGKCGPDDYMWSYDKERDEPIVKFSCGRKYYIAKGELREIETSFEEKGNETEATSKEKR